MPALRQFFLYVYNFEGLYYASGRVLQRYSVNVGGHGDGGQFHMCFLPFLTHSRDPNLSFLLPSGYNVEIAPLQSVLPLFLSFDLPLDNETIRNHYDCMRELAIWSEDGVDIVLTCPLPRLPSSSRTGMGPICRSVYLDESLPLCPRLHKILVLNKSHGCTTSIAYFLLSHYY